MTRLAYQCALHAGLTCGVWTSLVVARGRGVETMPFLLVQILLIVVALIGARLLYVLPRWHAYAGQWRRIADVREGGAAMFGGLLLAVPASVPLVGLAGLSLASSGIWRR